MILTPYEFLLEQHKIVTMYFLHPSTLLSLAAFLWPIIAANLETVKIESSFSFCTVNGLGDRVENPFDVIASVSEDATFNIDISTKSSKRGYLAGFGEDAAEGDNYQECQLGVKFYYKGEVSEITFGDWDMEGTVTLSRGFVARITARPGFWFQRDIMVSSHTFHFHAIPPIPKPYFQSYLVNNWPLLSRYSLLPM